MSRIGDFERKEQRLGAGNSPNLNGRTERTCFAVLPFCCPFPGLLKAPPQPGSPYCKSAPTPPPIHYQGFPTLTAVAKKLTYPKVQITRADILR